MQRRGAEKLLFLALPLVLLGGCEKRTVSVHGAPSAPPTTPMPVTTPGAAMTRFTVPPANAAERELDATFRGFEHDLPPATTLSEENGASIADCGAFGSVTYTRLQGIATRSAPRDEAALPALVKWARHPNACLRAIAIEMLLPKIGYDRNALSAPGMHDPEHYHFHDIMVTLQAYLAKKQIAYDARIFDGLELGVTEKDFATLIRGTWAETNIERKNYYAVVQSDGTELRVTAKHTKPDPKTPDHTWTTKIKTVTMNDRRQLTVTGAWSVESDSKGYQGQKLEPSQVSYAFWPVAPGIVWFKDGSYWEKMMKRSEAVAP